MTEVIEEGEWKGDKKRETERERQREGREKERERDREREREREGGRENMKAGKLCRYSVHLLPSAPRESGGQGEVCAHVFVTVCV